jgi:hypothetical protein
LHGLQKYLKADLEFLENQRLDKLWQWKDLSETRKAKYADGLANMLDLASGIKVRTQKNHDRKD